MEELNRLRSVSFPFWKGWTLAGSDRGMTDTLAAFARGMGYTVLLSLPTVSAPDSEACIYFEWLLIEVKKQESKVHEARSLCHEVAHEYTFDTINRQSVDDWQTFCRLEQMTEGVCYLVMRDYGFDTAVYSKEYMHFVESHLYKKTGEFPEDSFFEGKLDSQIEQCYAQFSRDFRHFLMDGGTDGISLHGAT